MSKDYSASNWRILVFYHLCTPTALAIVANVTLMDFLLLRMKIDLSNFGLVKSSMFFLPALSYFLATPILQRLNRDREVCAWAYMLRVTLPLPLPLLPLITSNQTILISAVMIANSLGFSCAMFANNSLLILLRKTLQEGSFNRKAAILYGLFNIPCSLFGLLVAEVFTRLPEISDRGFFLLFAGLQLIFALVEIPAARKLLRLKVPEYAVPSAQKYHWREYLRPFRDLQYKWMLLCNFLGFFWCAMLMTYWTVYLLTGKGLSITAVVGLEALLNVLISLLSSPMGRLADRYGFPRFCGAATLACVASTALFCLFPQNGWCFWLYTFLVHSGTCGLISGAQKMACQTAGSQLMPAVAANTYALAYSVTQAVGSFVGCIAAGKIYNILSQSMNQDAVFHAFWGICGSVPLLMTILAYCWYRAALKKD